MLHGWVRRLLASRTVHGDAMGISSRILRHRREGGGGARRGPSRGRETRVSLSARRVQAARQGPGDSRARAGGTAVRHIWISAMLP